MRALNSIRTKFAALADTIAAVRRRAEWDDFQCGDCERREQCGLPPDKNCVVKAAQLERNSGRPRRRAALTRRRLTRLEALRLEAF
jgi:hypothetical protein